MYFRISYINSWSQMLSFMELLEPGFDAGNLDWWQWRVKFQPPFVGLLATGL